MRAGLPLAAWAARRLMVTDGNPPVGPSLAGGRRPPAVDDTAVAAYLLNSARSTYRLDEICMEAFGECPPAVGAASGRLGGVLAERGRRLWRYWKDPAPELEGHGLRALYDEIERALVPGLGLMGRRCLTGGTPRPAGV